MISRQRRSSRASCRCGAVAFEMTGEPLAHAVCYCASCQQAGRQIELLPGAAPVLDADGGTDVVLFRKDRVRCVQGGERMQSHRLRTESPTRRLIATCCNSAVCLDFTKGHWLTVYRQRLHGDYRPPEMRVMTSRRRDNVLLSEDIPNYPQHSGKLMWKLLAAWILMGFRSPPLKGVPHRDQMRT